MKEADYLKQQIRPDPKIMITNFEFPKVKRRKYREKKDR